jgi:hypothetical protein
MGDETTHVEILIKEYESLRAEILASMHKRISIVTFGLAISYQIGNVILPC